MLKQITSVRVSFCPFSRHTTPTKVFLNRVLSKKNSTANPSCKIDVVTTNHVKDPATIDVTFKDGKKFHISSTAKLNGDDIIAQVQKYSKRLSQQEDLQSQ
ncbi:hypothetical protein IWW37_005637 [Coemansia sp. RSA 2050]|nr:hypothetical protein IWW37_005637 [Coemansia sp. RSA 2050]KAJ2729474.1 hypothetical protein IW152_005614 [Coemansia sp. BCRC 34962]